MALAFVFITISLLRRLKRYQNPHPRIFISPTHIQAIIIKITTLTLHHIHRYYFSAAMSSIKIRWSPRILNASALGFSNAWDYAKRKPKRIMSSLQFQLVTYQSYHLQELKQ